MVFEDDTEHVFEHASADSVPDGESLRLDAFSTLLPVVFYITHSMHNYKIRQQRMHQLGIYIRCLA